MISLLLSPECLDAIHAVVMHHCPCSLEDREFLPALVVAVEDELVRQFRPTPHPTNRSLTMNPTNTDADKKPTLEEIVDQRIPELCARLASQLDHGTRQDLLSLVFTVAVNTDEESAAGQMLNALWNELSEGL